MTASTPEQVRRLYDETCTAYAEVMDVEIELPMYEEIFARLNQALSRLAGPGDTLKPE